MNPEVEEVINGVYRVEKSLDSLAGVEDETKYYYFSEDGCFYKSGGEVGTAIESTIGKGILSSYWVGTSRWWTKESSFKLAKDLRSLNDDVLDLINKIASLTLSKSIEMDMRHTMHKAVQHLYSKTVQAAVGISRLIKTYRAEPEKQKSLSSISTNFNKVIEEIGKISSKIDDAIRTEGSRIDRRKRQEESQFHIDEGLKRRSFSCKTYIERKKLFPPRRSKLMLPLEISQTADGQIFKYLESHKGELLEQLEESPSNGIIIRSDECDLIADLAYFKDKVFVYLKEKSHVPGVKKVMRFSNQKIAMDIRTFSKGEEIQKAEKQLNILKKHREQKTRGIAQMKDHMTYLSGDRKHWVQSIFIRNYDQGSLYHCIANDSLSFTEKCHVMLDILYGIKAFHHQGFLHLNIHPETICVDKQSRAAKSRGVAGALIGFEQSMEDEECDKFTKAMDMWLLGHCMYALFLGEETEILNFLKTGTVYDVEDWEPYMGSIMFERPAPKTIQELVWLLMHPDEATRPTARKAIELLETVMHFEELKKSLTMTCESLVADNRW